MHKLPLLLEVSPETNREGQTVYLDGDGWSIISDHIDSELEILLHPYPTVSSLSGDIRLFKLRSGAYKVRIVRKGTEKKISVFAQKE